jgi:hypothetical protein
MAATFLLCATACGRSGGLYDSFVASHDAIHPGMSMQQVLESGLADYLIKSDGKNIAGATPAGKTPAAPRCDRHVVDIHAGGGAFTVRVYCDGNARADAQLAEPGLFPTKADLLAGLAAYETWLRSMSFRVESPALQVGGVYDSYEFSLDESGKVTSVASIKKSS